MKQRIPGSRKTQTHALTWTSVQGTAFVTQRAATAGRQSLSLLKAALFLLPHIIFNQKMKAPLPTLTPCRSQPACGPGPCLLRGHVTCASRTMFALAAVAGGSCSLPGTRPTWAKERAGHAGRKGLVCFSYVFAEFSLKQQVLGAHKAT